MACPSSDDYDTPEQFEDACADYEGRQHDLYKAQKEDAIVAEMDKASVPSK